ncbi:asparagine synthase (glutamine-hydrolyzing) [Amphibacillus sp. Q70]|uniref:asparagine synthase (glutamine-hydrolyzing) n=1 Tax=Amphibacillus sp. Q70 TaxID=3453416 RepID=UPI003F83BC2A
MNGFVGVLLKQDELKFSQAHLQAIKESSMAQDTSDYYQDSQMVLSSRKSPQKKNSSQIKMENETCTKQENQHVAQQEDAVSTSQDNYHETQSALSVLTKQEQFNETQPFSFAEGRYWLVWDGEIYNTSTLRKQLQKKDYHFQTHSEMETIAALFLEKGVSAFEELRGKFAILIWDKEEKKLYGARDVFGIKPLYYMENEYDIVFASEKKSISLLNQQNKLDRKAFQHYLSFQYVPEPLTMTEGINKLEAGHFFIKEWQGTIEKHRYFHTAFEPVQTNENQIIRRIQEVLFDSVNVHLQGDTSIGSFLSGGIDSTMIAAMAKQIDPNIKTFSVGFDQAGYSEIDIAKRTAEELDIENITRVVSPEEYIDQLPKIIWHLEDPLADPACIPLYFISEKAKKHVDTVLSGEGADELFGGYTIYREPKALKFFEYLPDKLLQAINKLATIFPEGMRGKSFLERGTTALRERYIGNAKIFEEAEKAKILNDYDPKTTYQSWTSKLFDRVEGMDPVEQMQYIDIHTWLTGDILLKAEKMTKAHGLEIRSPFLDKEVFHVARSISVDEKIADGTTKAILRKAMKDIVPEHVINQKKLGFPVPIKYWLRNELYSWAKNVISKSRTDDIIDKTVILELLNRHASGKQDYSRKIWTVLMFMLWHQVFIENEYNFEDISSDIN